MSRGLYGRVGTRLAKACSPDTASESDSESGCALVHFHEFAACLGQALVAMVSLTLLWIQRCKDANGEEWGFICHNECLRSCLAGQVGLIHNMAPDVLIWACL